VPPLTGSLLNVTENKRFKAGGVRFLGCLPIYDNDASLLRSEAKRSRRALEMFHDAMAVLSNQLSIACGQTHRMRAGNGREYLVVPRLAFVVADFQQIQQNTSLQGKGCHFCECPYENLDDTEHRWNLRSMRKISASMYRLADEVLDDSGKIKYGKVKVIKAWEKKHKTKFMENGFTPLLHSGFDICLFSPRDILHHIILGLFGKHIIGSIIFLLILNTDGLANPLFWESSPGRPAIMSNEKVNEIWHRLFLRLQNINEDDAGFTISSKMSKHFLKVYHEGKSSFTGPRMHLLMLAIPFVLRGLITPELNAIIDRINMDGAEHADWDIEIPSDPVDQIFEALLAFFTWYLTVRSPELPMRLLIESNGMAVQLIETLKRVFPKRNGKLEDPETAWKVGKAHDVLHVAENIALFGWTQGTSGEWGEHSHIELIKSLVGLINNKDIFLQFARFHELNGMVQREMQAGAEADGEGHQPRAKRKNSVENPPCELAVRYPLLHAAVHFKDLLYTKGSFGEHKQGRYILDLWSLPADRIPQLELAMKHPAIREIPSLLGVFAYDFLEKPLGLKPTSGMPTVEQINKVLTQNMNSELLRTFACLSLKLPGCQGVQRIRSYPFGPDDTFHGKNCRPSVFVIPPKRFNKHAASYHSFQFEGPQHAKSLWVGRVELFFTCSFKSPQGQEIPCELALLSFLYPFNVPAAFGPLQRAQFGCPMYYDPAPNHWYRVVPLRHIIGRYAGVFFPVGFPRKE